MRIALFTLDSALSAKAVLDFVQDPGEAASIVLIGRSDPSRPGMTRQVLRHLRQSGWRLLPYLLANFVLPQALARIRGWRGGGALTRWARSRDIPCVDVADINGPQLATALRASGAELILSFHFDQIFSAATLALAPRGGINVHPSLLPQHRGPLPAFWAMRERPPAFGVSVHRLVPRIDAGAILAQQAVRLPEDVSASTASRLLHEEGVALLRRVIGELVAGRAEPPPPPPLPYCPFPPAATLRAAARHGQHLVRGGDWRAGWAAPAG